MRVSSPAKSASLTGFPPSALRGSVDRNGAIKHGQLDVWRRRAWLMTSLSRIHRSFVSAGRRKSASIPHLLIPAGVSADCSTGLFLLGPQAAGTVLCAAFAVLVVMQRVTPVLLLVFVTLVAVTTALMYPVWQSIVPSLVPRDDLAGAIAANSAGVNVSRAIGPALGEF